MRRAPASVYEHNAERAAAADRVIAQLCESRGLDEQWRLAHRLIAACEGVGGEDALRVLVEELTPTQCETLAKVLLEVGGGR
jgi:hypothetical protein